MIEKRGAALGKAGESQKKYLILADATARMVAGGLDRWS